MIIFCILLCGCLSTELSGPSSIKSKTEINYTNNQLGFQVSYPSDWNVYEEKEGIYFRSNTSVGEIDIITDSSIVYPSSIDMLQKSFNNIYIKPILDTPGAKIIENSTISIADVPALQVVSILPSESGNLKQISILTVIQSRLFVFHYNAFEKYYDQNLPVAMKVFNSIRVLDKGSSTTYYSPQDDVFELEQLYSLKRTIGILNQIGEAIESKDISELSTLGEELENSAIKDLDLVGNIPVSDELFESKIHTVSFLQNMKIQGANLKKITPENYESTIQNYQWAMDFVDKNDMQPLIEKFQEDINTV